MSKKLVKSTSVIVCMTFLSRIFGFIRDMVTASFFGAGAMFDAFSVAFKIPNFMRRLFAEGSFSQAFVPVLSEAQKTTSKEEVQKFVNAMFSSLSLALVIVCLLGMIGAPWMIRAFAYGFSPASERFELAVTMLRITFPYLCFISLTAFSGAILNTYQRFWVAAFTPVLLNICMIAAAMWLAPHFAPTIIALAWGVFFAGILQLSFQIPFLKQLGFLPRFSLPFKHPGVKRVLTLMVPALFGVSVGQINLLVDTLFASFLTVGSVSWLYYADRLMEFPLGVFGVAISTVILPHLSRHHVTASHQSFSLTLDWALRAVLIIGLPAGIVLALLSGPLLTTLFQYGHFGEHAVLMSSQSLTAFALGIAPFMLIKILASGFYAKQDMRTPVRIGVIAMLANMLFNLLLISSLKHAGIALATSLSAVLNAVILYYFLRSRNLYELRPGWKLFLIRLFIANSLLALWLWLMTQPTAYWVSQNIFWRIEHLAFLLLSSVGLYCAALWISGLRIKDLLIPPKDTEQPN